MNFMTQFAIFALGSSLFASPSWADENNYNPIAFGNASGSGIANSNCNSALHESCGSLLAAPAPEIGGGLIGLLFIGVMVFVLLRQMKAASDF
ncbi:hypothetical protein [Terasakiella sp. SH-1]|uniref:hypothetical protein n=1 Tax=Terasakiella sp. SH-1 TaxID=2560057 RepID=UPI001073069A|nr:hypothetical protein [Terasakiella sp. SH-1]